MVACAGCTGCCILGQMKSREERIVCYFMGSKWVLSGRNFWRQMERFLHKGIWKSSTRELETYNVEQMPN